jgi:hypothetical protein
MGHPRKLIYYHDTAHQLSIPILGTRHAHIGLLVEHIIVGMRKLIGRRRMAIGRVTRTWCRAILFETITCNVL